MGQSKIVELQIIVPPSTTLYHKKDHCRRPLPIPCLIGTGTIKRRVVAELRQSNVIIFDLCMVEWLHRFDLVFNGQCWWLASSWTATDPIRNTRSTIHH